MADRYRYLKAYKVDMLAGRPRTVESAMAREWVSELLEMGFSRHNVATASGVGRDAVSRLFTHPESRILRATHLRLMRTSAAKIYATLPSEHLVPVTGTSRRVRALMRLGYRAQDIAAGAGVSVGSIRDLASRRSKRLTIKAGAHRAVASFYEEARLSWGPSNRTRCHAIRSRYGSPLLWGDDIDDPRVKSIRLSRPAAEELESILGPQRVAA